MRDPKLDAMAMRAMKAGATYKMTAELYGVARQTFSEWRQNDPDFAASLLYGRASGKRKALVAVMRAFDTDWRAAAWWLEHIGNDVTSEGRSLDQDENDEDEVMSLAAKLRQCAEAMGNTVPMAEAA